MKKYFSGQFKQELEMKQRLNSSNAQNVHLLGENIDNL